MTDGAVLPILHLNGYKIANPTVLARIRHQELDELLRGLRLRAAVRRGRRSRRMHQLMAATLDEAFGDIRSHAGRTRADGIRQRPRWPMMVLRTPKGWTGPKIVDGKPVEGTCGPHQVPVDGPREQTRAPAMLESWLRSYRPRSCSTRTARSIPELAALAPQAAAHGHEPARQRRIAAAGTSTLPDFRDYAVEVPSRLTYTESTRVLGGFLRDVDQAATEPQLPGLRTRRDGVEPLRALFEVTNRSPTPKSCRPTTTSRPTAASWRSCPSTCCEGWLEGYSSPAATACSPATRRSSTSSTRCSTSMPSGWKAAPIPWRRPIASLNYLLTSHVWRQDHNGFSHQDPGFIDHVVNKKATSFASISRPTPTPCSRSPTIACAAATTST